MKFDLRAEHVKVYLSLMAAILFGTYLRLRNITEEPLWLDELFSVAVSQPENSFSYVFQKTMSDVHPPFFQMVLWVFYKVFGLSEMGGRYLSSLFGGVLIPAIFVLGRQLYNVRVGLYAAWLAAVNFYLITYSQEIRSYQLLVLLTTLSFVFFIRAMRTLGWPNIFAYSVVAALLVNTHYFGFLVVFAQALLVLIDMLESPWDKRRLYRFGSAGLFIALCISPLLPYIHSTLERTDFWVAPPQDVFFIELFALYFGSLPLSFVMGGLLIVVVAKCVASERSIAWLNIVAVWVVVCIVVPYVRSIYFQPIITMRNMIVLLPAVLMLLALALDFVKERTIRVSLGALIFVFSMTPLFTEHKPVFTYWNQLKPVSEISGLVSGLIKKPVQWPMYARQYLEFGMCFKFLGSSLSVRSEGQLKQDLVSTARPENFYYLVSRGAYSPDEDFMKRYGVVLVEQIKVSDAVALRFHSLNLPVDGN